jgi:hypothetical protein
MGHFILFLVEIEEFQFLQFLPCR